MVGIKLITVSLRERFLWKKGLPTESISVITQQVINIKGLVLYRELS